MADVLVWLDMEMTGLDPDRERIIEVAMIITDGQLAEVATGPELVIHQSDEVLAAMDDWNKKHHGASGLTERVRTSTIDDAAAEAQLLAFIAAHVPAKERPVLAGNSIHQDRRFVRRYMPQLDKRLHYRMVDVSSIKELARRWYPRA
jgi:oligoribonuclease